MTVYGWPGVRFSATPRESRSVITVVLRPSSVRIKIESQRIGTARMPGMLEAHVSRVLAELKSRGCLVGASERARFIGGAIF
jgi:hypothetical protein